jgi:hypothetical protein
VRFLVFMYNQGTSKNQGVKKNDVLLPLRESTIWLQHMVLKGCSLVNGARKEIQF